MPSEVLRSPLRLASLRSTALLDTLAEPEFDRPSRLAARALRAPVALVSMVDEDRQFFKSCIGLPEPWASRRETPLSHSFCQHVVATGRPLVVEDARKDPLVRDNLAVDELDVAAYLGVPLRTPDGQVIGSFCVIDGRPREWSDEDREVLQDIAESVMTEIRLRLDIVGLRQARQEARISEVRYRNLIDQAPVGVQVYAADGTLVRLNRACEELWGISQGQLAGYNILRDPQLEDAGVLPLIRRAFAGETVASQPILYDPSRSGLPGRPRWVEATLYAVRGDGGAVGEVVLMLQDATERKREEEVQALKEGAERVRAIIETAHDAFVGFDIAGRIQHWNRRAEEVFGWPREEAIGMSFYELLIHERHRERIRGIPNPAPAPGESWRAEADATCRDGGVLPVELAIAPVPWGDAVVFAAFLRDISERRRADEVRARLLEQVLSAQEEERCRIARDLHDGVGQSLTTLLVGLSALEQVPSLDAARQWGDELRRVASGAIDEVRRMARGLRPSVLDDLGLVAALERCARDFERAHRIAVEFRAAWPDSRRLPRAVETTLYRIVQEALTNVAKHSGAGTVRIGLACEPARVLAVVEDDGVGFDREALARGADPGSGLGLSGMEERASLLDGSVSIESRPGGGTVLRVSIPLEGGVDGEDPCADR